MAKYQAELRQMFLSVFKDDHFLHDVDQDDAIAMVLNRWGETYESISNDIETDLVNGIPLYKQMEILSAVVRYEWERF